MQVETSLREAEQELRDFIENAVDGMHSVGPDGTILWANTAQLELLGYSRDEYVGRHIAEFHTDHAVIDDILARLWRNETLRNHPATMRCKDGTTRNVLINSSVFWRDGEFIHTRCVTRDVTDQRQIELQRQRAIHHLASEHAVTRILAEARPFHEVVPRLLETIGEVGDWQAGALWTVDESAGVLRCLELWHATGVDLGEFGTATRSQAFARGEGLPGRIWSAGDPVWIADVTGDGNFLRAPIAVQTGLRSALGLPVRVRGRVSGVLEFFSRHVRQPDRELMQMLDSVGTKIGHFIERREIDEVRDRLAAIVDSSDDAIVSKTLDGVITSWNRGAEHIFGYTPHEAIGQHISLIIPDDRRQEEDEVLARLRRGERIDHYETERRTKDDRRLNISLTVSPVRNADGTVIGASKVARDITEKKVAEEALRRSEQHAQAQVQARDEFLSIASHELRNPLNALQLQLVGLQRAAQDYDDTLPKEWVCQRVGQAIEDVGTLVRLVHNLLDVARLTAGRIDLEPEDLDFRAVVGSVLKRFGQQLSERGVVLDLAAVNGRADRLRFEQIVTNLISNAVKYGEEKPVHVTLRGDADTVYFSVKDHGIGIDPAKQQTLFERFSRAVPRRQYGGFGLGLWIVRETVRSMGGDISLDSSPGAGSTFSVSLPRIIAPESGRS